MSKQEYEFQPHKAKSGDKTICTITHKECTYKIACSNCGVKMLYTNYN
jgi:hypothetical protein